MYRGERFNGFSHLMGAVLAAAGMMVLIVLAARNGDPWKIVSFGIYGATLLALYTFSTLYHSLRGKAKAIFRKLDHAAIYLLIAGTYTPFTLVTLRGAWGWSLFGIVWGLAVLGIVQEYVLGKDARILSVVIYLVMGWMALVAIQPLAQALPSAGLGWLLAGGLFYTCGMVFYASGKILQYAHGIWHLFVLAGSASHYFAVVNYVA